MIILIDNINDNCDKMNMNEMLYQYTFKQFKQTLKIKISQIQLMMIFSKTYFEIMFVLQASAAKMTLHADEDSELQAMVAR